jgi:hypothetical protein
MAVNILGRMPFSRKRQLRGLNLIDKSKLQIEDVSRRSNRIKLL